MTTEVAVQLLLLFVSQSAKIAAMIEKAKAEGRNDLTKEELDSLVVADTIARKSLDDAIAAHS